jgi:hypothetical protein
MLKTAKARPARRLSRGWRRSLLVVPLLAALGLALLPGPVSAAPAASGARPVDGQLPESARTEHPGGTAPSIAAPTRRSSTAFRRWSPPT